MTDKENQQFIFGCIFLLSNKLQLLGDKVTGELTFKQWHLLNLLKRMKNPSPNFAEVARTMGTSRQNISKMMAVLEKKGMVRLAPSAADHRAVDVLLTKKGFDYFASKENPGNQLLDTLFAGVTPADTEKAAEILKDLLLNVETARKEGGG